MQIIAHRGWSIGEGRDWAENTIEAFIKSSKDKSINGVEIDIRRDEETGVIVLSHDAIISNKKYTTLDNALEYIVKQDWEVLIEFKEYDNKIVTEVNKLLSKYKLNSKALLFGFSKVTENFNWSTNRQTRQGIIIEYPWQIPKAISTYNPDVILLGWDYRRWTRITFKIWWSIFSLKKLTKKYNKKIVVGIANNAEDMAWLSRQDISMATLDVYYSIA